MKRDIINRISEWRNSSERKPLILQGARQVGKTYLLKNYAEKAFERVHYYDLEKSRTDLSIVFEKGDLNPVEIVKKLEFISNRKIDISSDVLIFDEIQAIPRAITSLKYFQEDMSQLAVMSAGSNLGVALADAPFPVGKVECMKLYPMTFLEFLNGTGEDSAFDFISDFDCTRRIDDFYHERLLGLLKNYFVTGGLPEVVNLYAGYKESPFTAFAKVRELQEQLILHYERDFSKYSGSINARHIARIFSDIPSQLSCVADGSSPKFKFKDVISKGFRSYESLADPIDWLIKAGLVHKIPIIEHIAIPFQAATVENRFKLMIFDVGILGAMLHLPPNSIINHNYGSYKGYFIENFILSELISYGVKSIASWRGRTSEVEFVIEDGAGKFIPVEVKAGANSKSKSLNVFIEKYSPETAIIFAAKKYGKTAIKKTCPLYMVSDFAKELKLIV